jgi:hypothetical protein
MLKFSYTKAGAPCYGFGLSERNLYRLRKGEPIRIDLAQMGSTGEVLIFYGRTELDMAQDLAEFIGPETKVNIDPKLTD